MTNNFIHPFYLPNAPYAATLPLGGRGSMYYFVGNNSVLSTKCIHNVWEIMKEYKVNLKIKRIII